MEEATELGNYLPLSFKTRQLGIFAPTVYGRVSRGIQDQKGMPWA